MKFGRKIIESAHPSFRNYYLSYEDLKLAIKVITGQQTSDLLGGSVPLLELSSTRQFARSPESQFQELLDNELNKINNFSNVEFSVLMEEIREVLYKLMHAPAGDMNTIRETIESIREEIVAFDEYIRLNFTGFRKALKKFDKWNESNSSNWFLQRVMRSDFMLVNIDRLLMGLSVAERKLRGVSSAPQLAGGKRTKFFIPPDEFVSIECELMKHMQIVYVGTTPGVQTTNQLVEGYLHSVALRSSQFGEVSQMEHVVIFDEDFRVYAIRRNKRLYESSGGYEEAVFSLRWTATQAKEGRCVIVKETHPKWVSVEKKTFEHEVRQSNLIRLMTRKISVDQFLIFESINANVNVCEFVKEFVAFTNAFNPSIMYSYRRTILRSETECIALDRDIKFVDLSNMAKKDIFSIPITVFDSILTQRTMTVWTSNIVPNWLSHILGKPTVSEVVGFSKAIHAEAVLHVVKSTQHVGLPHWFLHTISGNGDDLVSKFNLSMAENDSVAVPAASPMITAGKFDVMSNSQPILHDLAAAAAAQSAAPPAPPAAPKTPYLPASPVGPLEMPLLDHRHQPSTKSIWDELKFVLFGSVSPDLPAPSNIEPKTFLANERTFLNWCFVSFLISAVAITLVSLDPAAKLEAVALSTVSIITIAWSLNVYRLRVIALRNIKSLDHLLISSRGATTVALSAALALFITWATRLQQFLAL